MTADGPAAEPPEAGDPVTPAEVYVHRQRVGLPKWQGWAKAAREKLNAIIEDAHFPSPAGPPRWRHDHNAQRASPDSGPDFPTPYPPPRQHERCAAPWTRRGQIRLCSIEHSQTSILGVSS